MAGSGNGGRGGWAAMKNASSSTKVFGSELAPDTLELDTPTGAGRRFARGIGRLAMERAVLYCGEPRGAVRLASHVETMLGALLQDLRSQPWRRQVLQVVQMLHVIAVALAVWKGMAVVTNTESPVVVVLSGSMEPGYYRGDLLFLTKTSRPIEVGDVTVYRARNTEIPIVHRVIETHRCVPRLTQRSEKRPAALDQGR